MLKYNYFLLILIFILSNCVTEKNNIKKDEININNENENHINLNNKKTDIAVSKKKEDDKKSILKDPNAPKWYYNLPQSEKYLYAVSMYKSTNMQLALKKSKEYALSELSEKVHKTLISRIKEYLETASKDNKNEINDFSNTIADNITKDLLSKSVENERYLTAADDMFLTYVQIKLPLKEIKNSINKKSMIYKVVFSTFKSAKTYDDFIKNILLLTAKDFNLISIKNNNHNKK